MSHPTMRIDAIGGGHHHVFQLAAVLVLTLACSCTNGRQTTSVDNVASTSSSSVPDVAQSRAIYSPMLDYNNVWTPIGHGDPLKKDPTFDYSPPVLDRVRYWAETPGSAAPADTPSPSSGQANQIGMQTYHKTPSNPHSNVVHKTKSDILLLGVPATKRAQFKSVDTPMPQVQPPRRNYYAQLPTVLMPPPMQTNQHQHATPYNGQQHSSTPIAGHHYMQWMHAPQPADTLTQESGNFISFSLPDASGSMTTAAPPQPNIHPQTNRKKPWIQALLQKEVTRSTLPDTMLSTQQHHQQKQHTTTSVVSMMPSSSVYESHTQDFVPSAPAMMTPQPIVMGTTTTTTTAQHARPHYSTIMYTSPVTHSYPLSNHILDTIPPITWPETTTHFTPTVRPYMRPSSMGAGMTTDSIFSHYKQPQQPVAGPAYLIIEGHSKVKTYGNSPTGRHEPNVRPVQSTVDPVAVVTEVPADVQRSAAYRLQLADEERRFEVRHLHYHQQPTPEQQADELQMARAKTTVTMSAQTTTSTPDVMTTEKTSSAATPTSDELASALTPIADEQPTTTMRAPSRMSGLLSLLDTSFGDYFTGNAADGDEENEMITTSTDEPAGVSTNNIIRTD